MKWPEIQERHLDKLLLTLVLFVLIATAIFGHAEWAQRMADNAQGALIAIITGRALSRAADRNGEKKGPNGTANPNK